MTMKVVLRAENKEENTSVCFSFFHPNVSFLFFFKKNGLSLTEKRSPLRQTRKGLTVQ